MEAKRQRSLRREKRGERIEGGREKSYEEQIEKSVGRPLLPRFFSSAASSSDFRNFRNKDFQYRKQHRLLDFSLIACVHSVRSKFMVVLYCTVPYRTFTFSSMLLCILTIPWLSQVAVLLHALVCATIWRPFLLVPMRKK